MNPIPIELHRRLQRFGQLHLVAAWDQLSRAEQEAWAAQLAHAPLEAIDALRRNEQDGPPGLRWAERAEPPQAIERIREDPTRHEARRRWGWDALARGEVGVILVAGGQGTRLGFDHPKGMLPVGPLSQRTLFQVLFDRIAGHARRAGRPIPVAVMTSPATRAETERYFESQRWFGFDPQDVQLFCQGTMPCIELDSGRLLMADRDRLCLSPDGHGGMLAALVGSGLFDRLRQRGLRRLFYGQIDNPLLQVCDPWTLGVHFEHRSQLTTQVIRKRDPLERVGNVVQIDGRLQVIEYSDLPEAIARQTRPDGALRLWAGSIAVHVFEMDFLDRVRDRADALPFHTARKRVAHWDRGEWREPAQPNAIKFERFIFDLLPLAERAVVVEIDPRDGFAAIKNAPPAASETLATAQAAMIDRDRRWLHACGVDVAEGVAVEIDPRWAADPDELCDRVRGWEAITRSAYLTWTPDGGAA